jgi:restriction system protein
MTDREHIRARSQVKRFPRVSELTPARFELQVKKWLESVATTLQSFSAIHQEQLQGADGEYSIDVTARFEALAGATFLVLVECKKHKNPIKREVVQALHAKQQSVGAQKAMVVSTSAFQSGAVEYAAQHGIALVQVTSGTAAYVQASAGRVREIPGHAEDYAGLFYGPNPDGRLIYPEIVTSRSNYALGSHLGTE